MEVLIVDSINHSFVLSPRKEMELASEWLSFHCYMNYLLWLQPLESTQHMLLISYVWWLKIKPFLRLVQLIELSLSRWRSTVKGDYSNNESNFNAVLQKQRWEPTEGKFSLMFHELGGKLIMTESLCSMTNYSERVTLGQHIHPKHLLCRDGAYAHGFGS